MAYFSGEGHFVHDDPAFAVEYLNEIFADGDQKEMMTALRRVAEAYGGVSTMAEAAKLNATTIYRTLCLGEP